MSTHNAFLFIKPHAAASDPVETLVTEMLKSAGVSITSQGVLGANEIDERRLIDVHYGAIANRAVLKEPSELNVPESAQEKFETAFGLKWAEALDQGLVFNATGASQKLSLDGAGLELVWRAIPANELVKFGGGFYCGKLKDGDGNAFYAINCFYLNMRADFTTPPAQIRWFAVEFPTTIPWADFRGKILGATDPTKAVDGSIRNAIYNQWESLELSAQPSTGCNGVHASASPIEGLFERMNWLGADVSTDVYGSAMVEAGVPVEVIKEWSNDPAVAFEDGKFSLFDLHEDLDYDTCLAKSVAVYANNCPSSPVEPIAPGSPGGSGLKAARALGDGAAESAAE
mmetsp:Transcript_52872/g.67810  ORF Transcript_52872/g.67810 Transcript_52872/m.67810 type:complete len:343 (+) Transcript_52872:16-1044(+)